MEGVIEQNFIPDQDLGSEEEEFSFFCGEGTPPHVAANDAFINGQIKPVFPLFNRELFFTAEELDSLNGNLPQNPPVKRVFVETKDSRDGAKSSTSAAGIDAILGGWPSGNAVEVTPQRICRKSNSTGFSKLWRFKEFIGRSNSDGRDAFVFLNDSHTPPQEKVEKKTSTATKVNGKVKKGNTTSLSAHEAYLRSKAKEAEEKRRSYLPYRPELMGFFTNVNGGLSKNTHPY